MTFGTERLEIRRGQGARQAPASNTMPAALIVLLLLVPALLLPEELSFYIGGLRITAARAILLIAAPFCLLQFLQLLTRAGERLMASDVLVIAAAAWMVLAACLVQGPEKAMTSAAILALEFSLPYIMARLAGQQVDDVVRILKVVCISISIVAALALLDSLLERFVMHDIAKSVTGYERPAQKDYRMGLLRATGTLEHPILLGVVCTISILLSFHFQGFLRQCMASVCLLGLIFSFSAAPLGGLVIGLGLFGYDRLLQATKDRWRIAIGVLIAGVVVLMLVSKDPLGFVLSNFTFDPESSYFRLLIWHYGSDAIMGSPLFGIGVDAEWFREDWMPKSVDAFWLMTSLNFGIPAALLVGATWVAPCLYATAAPATHAASFPFDIGRLAFALNVVMVVLVAVGMTVHFWGATWMLISLIAGLRASLSARDPGASR